MQYSTEPSASGDFTGGTVATYSCADGYELVGDKNRTCLVDGTWTGVEPQCTGYFAFWYKCLLLVCLIIGLYAANNSLIFRVSNSLFSSCLLRWPAWLGCGHTGCPPPLLCGLGWGCCDYSSAAKEAKRREEIYHR